MTTSADPRFILGDGDVHVWHADLQNPDDANALELLLSADEVARANRFRFPEHRRRFVIARGGLRQLLAAYLGTDPKNIAFHYEEAGKPHLAAQPESRLCFNVSHSGDIAALAFSEARDVGVDVEVIRRDVDVDEIPKRFFSLLEQKTLAGLQSEAKYKGFFNCWTRKEAYVKAVGSGLSLPLRDFDVSLIPGEAARLLATRPDPAAAARWSMASLDLGEERSAAVVLKGAVKDLHVRHFVRFP